MKKIIITICAIVLTASMALAATPDKKKKSEPKQHTVVFCSDVECKNCEKKVMDNLSFEKGVKGLSVDIAKQTVTVTYDAAKSDTTTLAKALRKLGYKAEVKEFK